MYIGKIYSFWNNCWQIFLYLKRISYKISVGVYFPKQKMRFCCCVHGTFSTKLPHFSTHNALQADACAWLGLSQKIEQTRLVTPQPSRGGGRCYDVWFQEEQLAEAQAGDDVDVSEWSLCQWFERLDPYCQTENKAQEQVVGFDLLIIVSFLRALLKMNKRWMNGRWTNNGGTMNERQTNNEQTMDERWTNNEQTMKNERWTNNEWTTINEQRINEQTINKQTTNKQWNNDEQMMNKQWTNKEQTDEGTNDKQTNNKWIMNKQMTTKRWMNNEQLTMNERRTMKDR